ncbi:T-cell surface glycoprotein CD3 delta chain-like [Hypomesus transpacificus]|uniref:T-cell surface glycoprotein CD3 delta chain-like n=1 Tax=Hypomesus transpacificus TaxID=137520 RepID=UPI001F083CED|nr:T-cell surface glycoprotein CD3 delta chain-like [Hypomesus transpacificus]
MKTLLLASVLLVWTMRASSVDPEKIKVFKEKDGIRLECPKKEPMELFRSNGNVILDGKLQFNDDNTGEYTCKGKDKLEISMYVKFRTCKNCIELDPAAAAGMAIGNLVATVMIGVAVYHIASQSRGTRATVQQASDRRALIPNESKNESHYQKLNVGTRSNDTYSYARTG